MWKVYKYNGRYIMGDHISNHSSESAALKKAKKVINFKHTQKEKKKDEILIWLDGENHEPMGVIIHKIKGAKRSRQGKEKG